MLQFLEETTAADGGLLGMLPMLLIMFGLLYFMMIRPESKRKKEAEAMRSALKKGDEITTIGGIMGVVVDVKENTFVVETGADQVRIEFAKWALSTNETAAKRAKEQQKKIDRLLERLEAVEEVMKKEHIA